MRPRPFLLPLAAVLLLALPGALADEGPGPQVGLVGSYDTINYARDVVVAGNYAYVADHSDGLAVVDVSDPTNPTHAGGYDTSGFAYGVAVAGGYAYVADGSRGLLVVDVSDPTNPTRAGGYDTSGSAMGVAVAGGYAYVADGDGGLVVVDVSAPANPTRAGGYDTSGYSRGVAVAGGYAYVADAGGGLVVVDVSDPANPTRAGGYDTDYAYGVTVAGDYAYVADGYDGLVVVDVSDPANPFRAGGYDTSGFAYGVALAGGYAYVADGSSGLVVVDVSDPTNPTLAGRYDTPDYAYDVALAGGYAYVADDDGLVVLGQTSPWWQTPLILVALGIAAYSASFSFLTRRVFRETEQALEEWESAGVNTSPVRKLLAEGHQKWERFNHPAAMGLAAQAKEKGERHAWRHGNVKRTFNHIEKKLQGYEAEGVQVGPAQDILEQARSAWDEMDFEKAEELARKAGTEGEELESQYQAAAERVTELRAKIADFEEKGINTDELERVLAECEAEMGAESEE